MAKLVATGAARPIPQITTVTLAGTWASTETVTIKVGVKSVVYTCGSGETPTTVAAALVALCQASTDLEFREITWTVDTAVITGTSAAGNPVTITTSETAAAGTSTAATPQAATGPNHWDNINNWSTGAVPTTADEVTIDSDSIDLRHGLPTSLTLGKFVHTRGRVGLPDFSAAGYPEYRPTRAVFTCLDVRIGQASGQGPALCRLDLASGASIVAVYGSSGRQGSNGAYAIDLLANNSAAVISVLAGQVSICVGADEATEVESIRVGANALVAIGEATVVADVVTSGNTLLLADCDTLTVDAGNCIAAGGSVPAAVLVRGGTLVHKTTGVITAAVVGPGVLDCSQDIRPRTITDLTLNKGGQFRDLYTSMTVTNGIVLGGDADILSAT